MRGASGRKYLLAKVGDTSLVAALSVTYVHLFVVGWLTPLIFGVALWLFPKMSESMLSVQALVSSEQQWL